MNKGFEFKRRQRTFQAAFALGFWFALSSAAAGNLSMSGTVQRRIQIPDSLVGKLGSGILEMRLEERLQAVSKHPEILESEKVLVHIYISFYPSMIQTGLLDKLGVVLYPDTWIPPLENHPLGFFLAELPPLKILDVLSLPFVKRVDTAERTAEPQNNNAYKAIKADLVWEKGFDGTGVKVAILDSGLDTTPTNDDLPTSFQKKDYSAYPTLDDGVENTVTGHGTHVTGTVLGRGVLSASNTGNGGGAYKGMAPDADLVFLKIGRDADAAATTAAMEGAMIDAVNVYHAKIITMSYGGWGIYNDGSESTEQTIDWCFGQGKAVFISAGNDANKGRHFSGTVGTGQSGYIQVNVSGALANDTKLEFNLVWRDGAGTSNALSLHYYNNVPTELLDVTRYSTTESSRGTESQVSVYNSYASSGTYYLKVYNSSSNTVNFHLYEFWSNGKVTFASPDPQYTVSSPSTADHAMSMAAWTTRKIWRDANGDYWQYSSETEGAISTFSSRGPRIDGVQKPDIAAPGSVIISIRDRDLYTSANAFWVDNDGTIGSGDANYYVMQGTSMACPAAAGAAALLLDKDPSMTPQELYDSMKNFARHDSYTGAVPNSTWGFGKLNVDSVFSSTVFVEAKLFLEGPYYASGDTMKWELQKAGQVPSTPPYAEDNTRSISIPAGIVDWVLVQLRGTPGGAAVASKSALLRKDGRIVADNGSTTRITLDAPAGSYYVVVKQRNHLAAMSAGAVTLSTSGSTLYDFSAADMCFGTNPAKLLESGVWGLWSGDINQDKYITTMDYTTWYNSARAGDTGYKTADINLNVQVTTEDYTMWYNNARSGAASGVP
jgi:subtilisin family serine protease